MKVDKETLKDLEIFNTNEGQTIFDIADFTTTKDGKKHLKYFFKNPKNSKKDILQEQEALKFIIANDWDITIHKNQVYFIKQYLDSNISPIKTNNKFLIYLIGNFYQFRHKESGLFNYYEYLLEGVQFSYNFIAFFYNLYNTLDENTPKKIKKLFSNISDFFEKDRIQKLFQLEEISFTDVFYYDNLFRRVFSGWINILIDTFFKIDAYISLKNFITKYNLNFPKIVNQKDPIFEAKNIYHLFLNKPKKNDIKIDYNKNFIFLTGPNMSGKTTLLKACGLSTYFAHLGLGVPADSLKISYFDEIITDINTRDSIQMGYSYFYSEVKRVKKISSAVSKNKNVFVILDELFRGTNIKDAYQGTEDVIKGVANWNNSMFILSTHLIEVSNKVNHLTNIKFKKFETRKDSEKIEFDYKLKNGVSRTKIGYLILKREKIFDILNKENNKQS